MSELRVLGVCAAQGALLYPFKDYVVGNIEPRAVFHTPKEEQWKLNFGDIPFVRTPQELDTKDIDIIVGSPSCGHSSVFSYSRKKTLGKPREDITLNLYLSSVKKYLPQIFLLENLPKLLEVIQIGEWEHNLPEYNLIVHCHPVTVFGNSQKSRKRLVLIGVRKDSRVNPHIFDKTFRICEILNLCQIKRLVNRKKNYRESDDKKLAMYHFADKTKRGLTVAEVRKLWKTEFKNDYKWPMRTHKMKTLPGVYRNRRRALPLTVRPSSRQFNPHGRIMGLEEYRVIMGFPETFKVYFDEAKATYWLNKGRNTITKGSVAQVGYWFLKCIKDGKYWNIGSYKSPYRAYARAMRAQL